MGEWSFEEWTRVVVAEVRRRLPSLRATRRGVTVYLRVGGEEVVVRDGATLSIRRTGALGAAILVSRRDRASALVAGKSIAGMLDAAQSLPEAAPADS